MNTVLLQTTYFGPIQWYQKLYRYDHVLIEQYDSYQKQTFRNRCVIATANGLQALTVPVEHPSPLTSNKSPIPLGGAGGGLLVKDLRISDHNQWRRIHWNALQSAYSESPFFEYYADDIRPFFEQKYDFLIDFNEAIRQKMCELIDIHPHVEYTQTFLPPNLPSLREGTGVGFPTPLTNLPSLREGTGVGFPTPPSNLPSLREGTGVGFPTPNPLDLRSVISAKHPLPDADFESKPYWQVFQQKHGFQPNLSILDLLFNQGPESIFYL